MNYIVAVLFSAWESYWRRGFGGLWNDTPIIENRALQHVLNSITMLLLFWYRFDIVPQWQKVLTIVYVIAIVEGLYWSRGHGYAFDLGRDGQPDEKMLKRYEKPLFNRFFLTPLYNLFGWRKYGYSYDLFSMALRYTLPCVLLIPVFSWHIVFMGLLVSPIYAFCWTFRERENARYGSTALAEWIVGAWTGLCLSLI